MINPIYVILLPTSLICIILAVYLYDIFLQMDYIRSPPPWSNYAGFTNPQFYAYLMGTVLGPIGLLLLLLFSVHAYKSSVNSIIKAIVFTLLFAASIACSVFAYPMGQEILDCGIFCAGYPDTDSSTNSKFGYGAVVSVGVMYFVLSVTATLVFAYLLCLILHDIKNNTSSQPNVSLIDSASSSLKKSTPPEVDYKRSISLNVGFTLGILFPFILFCVISLPTWWAHFTRYRLTRYMSRTADQKYGYHWTIELNNDFHLHIFPDIFMYYTAIYLVCVVGIISNYFPRVRQLLCTRPKWIPFKRNIGEFLLLTLLVTLIIAQFMYFSRVHCYERKPCDSRSKVERAARAAGLVANLLLGFLLLPVSRQSFLIEIMNVSWEQMIEYHRWLASMFMCAVISHIFLQWKFFDEQGFFPHDILAVPMKYHADNFTNPAMVVITIFMFLFMGVLAFSYIRRSRYELFLLGHSFVVILMLMISWHATMVWYYTAPGISVYIIDHILRFYYQTGYQVTLTCLKAHSTGTADEEGTVAITELSYTASSSLYSLFFPKSQHHMIPTHAGQICFINIPALSYFEWHPFTVSSLEGNPVITHHIKTMKANPKDSLHRYVIPTIEWTEKLFELAQSIQGEKSDHLQRIIVNIDGPYGVPLRIDRYSHILMVAGGIGITPMQAHFRSMCRQDASTMGTLRLVSLVWVTRSVAEVDLFLRELNSAVSETNLSVTFECDIYITKKANTAEHKSKESGKEQELPVRNSSQVRNTTSTLDSAEFGKLNLVHVHLHHGRPDLRSKVEQISSNGLDALVYVCGPSMMVESLQDMSQELGVDFRQETFHL